MTGQTIEDIDPESFIELEAQAENRGEATGWITLADAEELMENNELMASANQFYHAPGVDPGDGVDEEDFYRVLRVLRDVNDSEVFLGVHVFDPDASDSDMRAMVRAVQAEWSGFNEFLLRASNILRANGKMRFQYD